MNSVFKSIKHLIQGGILSAGLLFAANTQADWYGPFGTPITEFVYKVCHEQVWIIATIGILGDVGKRVEICAYYDENDDIIGYSMKILN